MSVTIQRRSFGDAGISIDMINVDTTDEFANNRSACDDPVPVVFARALLKVESGIVTPCYRGSRRS